MPQLGMPYANTFNAPTEGLFQQATKGGLFVRHFFSCSMVIGIVD
jgi:hypothetical protein